LNQSLQSEIEVCYNTNFQSMISSSHFSEIEHFPISPYSRSSSFPNFPLCLIQRIERFARLIWMNPNPPIDRKVDANQYLQELQLVDSLTSDRSTSDHFIDSNHSIRSSKVLSPTHRISDQICLKLANKLLQKCPRTWSSLDSRIDPKFDRKSDQNWHQNWSQKWSKTWSRETETRQLLSNSLSGSLPGPIPGPNFRSNFITFSINFLTQNLTPN